MLITLGIIAVNFKLCALGSSCNTKLALAFNLWYFCILFKIHILEKNMN